jgi:hypothetical protein
MQRSVGDTYTQIVAPGATFCALYTSLFDVGGITITYG